MNVYSVGVKDLKLGDRFRFGKTEFIKLDNSHGGCLCLAADVWFNARFDENDKNNWETSLLREELTARIGSLFQQIT